MVPILLETGYGMFNLCLSSTACTIHVYSSLGAKGPIEVGVLRLWYIG
jgi:hypothetical protein